jgi:uncharacterized protein
MRILVDIGHPADFHFLKNAIWKLESDGHEVKITARDKEMTTRLLEAYDFKYHNLGKNQKGLANKAIGMIKTDFKLYKIAKNFNPDVLTGIHNPYIAHVGRLLGKPSLIFTDTEHAKLASILTFPFSTAICTPSCFKNDLGKKQTRYDGYHELAYLHPDYFTPNYSILNEIGLQKNERFIVIRFVSWDASHDVGHHGIQNKINLVGELEKYGRVLITSESKLPVELEPYRFTLSPEKMHDLLYYATLYIGEGASMATESGILGTPSIYVSSLVDTMGNFIELTKKYGLVYTYKDSDKALNKALELVQKSELKEEWRKRREGLLNDKIDVTKFMVETIEKYGGSLVE